MNSNKLYRLPVGPLRNFWHDIGIIWIPPKITLMKRFIVVLLVCLAGRLQAQDPGFSSQLKTSIGYSHDFPGLNGYSLAAEHVMSINGFLAAGLGAKYANLNGYPRTAEVNEFTRAETLDFTLYWLPVNSERSCISIGLGYSFSFYHIQRAFATLNIDNNPKPISWHAQEKKGRTSGVNFVLEYEYHLLKSPFSFGLRAASYKTYETTYFIGPVVGYRF